MFICAITKKPSKHREECIKLVVEKRPMTYTQQVYDEDTDSYITVEIGRGWEIKKEINVSEEGLRLYKAAQKEDPDFNWRHLS